MGESIYSFLQHSVLFPQKFYSRPELEEPEPEEDHITCQKAKILERPNIVLKKYWKMENCYGSWSDAGPL
jgi:hypothetical protein